MSQNEESSSRSLIRVRRSTVTSSPEDGVPAVWDVGDVILGLYEVKEVFWPGATGLAYRVRHREWDIDLAVKSPRETPFQTDQETEDFISAADEWVGLGLYPHIVSCYYVRKLGGIPRLFLEFIDGGSLEEWIHTRSLYEGGAKAALSRLLDISIQFAWGLQFAHDRGLIHGDVKPSNVLLTPDATAKLKGFAFAFEESSKANNEGVNSASAFHAPELTRTKELSNQTDIWSWAASVLEMFTGELRWREGELSDLALEGCLNRKPPDDDIPIMPATLVGLLRWCLHRDPGQRPGSMAEIASLLREIYRDETGSDYQRTQPIRISRRAEELNNRALSLLDLGRKEEALRLWEEALKIDPQHLEATYNSGLVRWRAGRITDDDLIRLLEGLKNSEPDHQRINDFLGRVHLERDDVKAASEVVETNESSSDKTNDVGPALALRKVGLQAERPLTAFLDEEIFGPNAFTPDGKSLLLTVSGFKIRILDFAKPLSPRYLHGHTEAIYALAMGPDGRYALTSSADGTIRLWDLLTVKCTQAIRDNGWCHPDLLALSADGKYGVLRFDSWDPEQAQLQLWDVRAGRWIRDFDTTVSEYGARQFIFAISLSPDGKYLLTGGDCGTVQLWNAATGKLVRELKGLWGYIRFVQFSPDGARCFAANHREVREFDLHSGVCVEATVVDEEDSDSKISLVTVSADGNRALCGSSYGELRLWDINTGKCLRTFQDLKIEIRSAFGGSYEAITSIKLSADGKYLLTGTRGETFKLWQFNPEYHAPMVLSRITATEEAIRNQSAAEENLASGRKAIAEKRFINAANHIRAARSVPGYERSAEAFELWSSLYVHLRRTRIKASWPSHTLQGQEFASSISFDRDGKYVLFGGFNMELKEVATGKSVRVFDKAMRGNAALSGDARLIMIGGWEDYELWDTMSGHRIDKIYSCHEKHVKDLKVSVDGKYAVSCTEKAFNPWEITHEGPRYLRSTQTDWGELSGLAISSDNKYCVGGTGFSSGLKVDYRLRLWELPSGECVQMFEGYDSGTYALVFTPDNKCFLGGGYDHKLRLWDIATGTCLRLFEGHTQPVYAVDISADGKYALSGSTDQTLRLWEIATGESLRTWEIKTDFIGPVRFTSDCKYVLAGTTGQILRVEVLDWELEDPENRSMVSDATY